MWPAALFNQGRRSEASSVRRPTFAPERDTPSTLSEFIEIVFEPADLPDALRNADRARHDRHLTA